MVKINKKQIAYNELLELYPDYIKINQFIEKHNDIDYVQFDYYIVNDISLFTTAPDFDFNILEQEINKIIKTLPAIHNIFTKPLLHLKENPVVVPVEAVRVIGNDTIQHIFSHSELWENLQDDNIKPLKLQTRIYKDNYAIYENLIFCDAIDRILIFLRRNLRFLKDMILTKQIIELNLLDRVNHIYYFLALGKLHTGYLRLFDKFSDVVQRSYVKLNYISDEVCSKLGRPVYKKNKKRPPNLRLRKTNILSMHKDYRQIYSMLRFFGKKESVNLELLPENLTALKMAYANFCQLLSIFAIGHFNFRYDTKKTINFDRLGIWFDFKKWRIRLSSRKMRKYKVTQLKVTADTKYKIVFIPIIDDPENRSESIQKTIDVIRSTITADEYIICTPHEYDEYFDSECHLGISNIESFRRIQQILLRAMVLTDDKREECPFCSHKLTINQEMFKADHKAYTCDSCRTTIVDTVCNETNLPYTYTSIYNLKHNRLMKEDFERNNMWLYYRKVEAQMFFRNITKLDEHMEAVCPHCHKTHK